MQTPSSSIIIIFKPLLDATLDIATYNWPSENIDCGRYTPTCLRDCLWLLLIVIAKHIDMGNCLRWNWKGTLVSDGESDSLVMYTLSPMLLPVITLASRTYLPILVITNLVPFHRPAVWSKFLNNITRTPTFNFILWFGRPDALIVFRNSGVLTSSDQFPTKGLLNGESQLKYVFSSSRMRDKI